MRKLENILFELGIYQNRQGFNCIVIAVELASKNPAYLKNLTTALYPAVARCIGCSSPAVERSIRYAISCAWANGPEAFSRLARRGLTQPPTVGNFICMLCNHINQAASMGYRNQLIGLYREDFSNSH